mgnify:CR=1 FL=1
MEKAERMEKDEELRLADDDSKQRSGWYSIQILDCKKAE